MRAVLELFLAEHRRSWLLFRRYTVQSATGMIMTTLLFLALVYGAQFIAGGPSNTFGDRLESIIVGYVLWNMLMFAMGEISAGLQQEAQIGTLEQLFLTPFGSEWIFLFRALGNQLLIFFLNILVLAVILLATGTKLTFPPALFLPLGLLLLGVYGLGYILGSLSLLFKRIGALRSIFQFVLMALIIAPLETMLPPAAVRALPLVPGAVMLRDLMARGESLSLFELGITAVNCFTLFMIGVVTFRWMESRAKRLGVIGTY